MNSNLCSDKKDGNKTKLLTLSMFNCGLKSAYSPSGDHA